MSVTLNPSNSLGFNRPLTQTVKRSLSLTNHNALPVAFKVKTTAPKLYCVRPNSGRIEPGETVEVSVMLQAMREEPPAGAKCKDKFLIQSTIITTEKETLPLQEIWNSTGDSEESRIHQHKIRVVYLPPEGQTVEEEDENAAAPSGLHPSDSRYETVRQHPGANGHPPEQTQDESDAHIERVHTPPQESAEERRERQAEAASAPAPAPRQAVPPPAAAPATVPPVVTSVSSTTSNVELLAKYNEAQAEIQRLRALLAAAPEPSTEAASSSGAHLRRRTRALSDATSTIGGSLADGSEIGTAVDGAIVQQEGIPLQVVVIIALGVFITTYLFF